MGLYELSLFTNSAELKCHQIIMLSNCFSTLIIPHCSPPSNPFCISFLSNPKVSTFYTQPLDSRCGRAQQADVNALLLALMTSSHTFLILVIIFLTFSSILSHTRNCFTSSTNDSHLTFVISERERDESEKMTIRDQQCLQLWQCITNMF